MNLSKRYRLFAIFGVVSLVLDQITKIWARSALAKKPITVIEGYWDFHLSFNTGSAFSMFSELAGARVLLTLIGIGACGFIFYMVRKGNDRQVWTSSALGLVAGGALGNVIDRVLEGKVTDFIVWKYSTHQWPAFNIADAALVVGVGILFLDVNKESKMKDKKKGEPEAKPKSK